MNRVHLEVEMRTRAIPCPEGQRLAWEKAMETLIEAAYRLEPDAEELALRAQGTPEVSHAN